MPEQYSQGAHSLLGVFTFALPAGIVALLIFYWVAPHIAFLLPSPHREALQPRIKVPRSLREVLTAGCGIVLGAETHILWDSFTHESASLVERIRLLHAPLFGTRFPVYLGLEFLSSTFGLCILVFAYRRWMTGEGFRLWVWQRPGWRFYLWLVVLTCCFAAGMTESHTMPALVSLEFLRHRHFGFVFITSFVRDALLVSGAVAILANVLRPRSQRDHAAF
jgi:hypothetical protein